MSVEDLKFENPQVVFSVLDGFAGISAAELQQRFIAFEFEDHDKKMDKISLRFENSDGRLLEPARIALGVALEVSFGYPDLRQIRTFIIRRLKGFVQKPRLGAVQGRAGDLGVALLEGYGKLIETNRLANPIRDRFQNVTRSEAVRQIMSRHVTTERLFIEDSKRVFEEIPVKRNETEGHFVRRMANGLGFTVGFSANGFHFHRAGFTLPTADEFIYLKSPDVISFEIDGDLTIPTPAIVEAKSWDVVRRLQVVALAKATVGSNYTEYFVPEDEPRSTPQRQRLKAKEVLANAKAEKTFESAVRKLNSHIDRHWKLKLRVVGNPRVQARFPVKLTNFGDLLDGTWYVKQCTHRIDGNGYVTDIELHGGGPGLGSPAKINFQTVVKTGDPGDSTIQGSNYGQLD